MRLEFGFEKFPFDLWLECQNLPVGQRSPGDNPAGDGISNLLKFAFELDPNRYVGDVPGLRYEIFPNDLVMTFQPTFRARALHGVDWLDLTPEMSTDALNWIPVENVQFSNGLFRLRISRRNGQRQAFFQLRTALREW